MTQRQMVTNIAASEINLSPTTDGWATEASCCLTNVNNYVSASAFIQKKSVFLHFVRLLRALVRYVMLYDLNFRSSEVFS